MNIMGGEGERNLNAEEGGIYKVSPPPSPFSGTTSSPSPFAINAHSPLKKTAIVEELDIVATRKFIASLSAEELNTLGRLVAEAMEE